LYGHYRARALWNLAHGAGAKRGGKKRSKSADSRVAEAFTLKRSRDAWAKGAYTPGTPDFRARTQLAGGGARPRSGYGLAEGGSARAARNVSVCVATDQSNEEACHERS